MNYEHFCYLDNSATTKPCKAALEKYAEVSTSCYGNPSSLHHFGFLAEQELKVARLQIASSMGTVGDSIIFTGSGTESNNLAIRGLANLHIGNKIVLTDSEHPAVFESVRSLEKLGFEMAFIPTKGGELDLNAARRVIDKNTALVCVMLVNNESGAVYKVNKIADIIAENSNAKFHIDAVQAYGKIPFSAPSLRCDTLAVSAHKVGGTKGVGALYAANPLSLAPIIYGGGQERGLRSGTENVAGTSAFGEAVRTTFENHREKLQALTALRAYATEKLKAIGAVVNEPATAAPHIINFSVPHAKSEPMLHILEGEFVYVSVGSACSSRKKVRSHVLLAMGVPNELIDCALRMSFSFDSTEEDVDALIRGLEKGKRMLIR